MNKYDLEARAVIAPYAQVEEVSSVDPARQQERVQETSHHLLGTQMELSLLADLGKSMIDKLANRHQHPTPPSARHLEIMTALTPRPLVLVQVQLGDFKTYGIGYPDKNGFQVFSTNLSVELVDEAVKNRATNPHKAVMVGATLAGAVKAHLDYQATLSGDCQGLTNSFNFAPQLVPMFGMLVSPKPGEIAGQVLKLQGQKSASSHFGSEAGILSIAQSGHLHDIQGQQVKGFLQEISQTQVFNAQVMRLPDWMVGSQTYQLGMVADKSNPNRVIQIEVAGSSQELMQQLQLIALALRSDLRDLDQLSTQAQSQDFWRQPILSTISHLPSRLNS